MKVGVTANPHKPLALSLARRAVDRLGTKAEVVVGAETQSLLHLDVPSAPLEELRADAVVAIGGDGTFLWTLHRTESPLLPINAGTFGFLAEVDGEDVAAFDTALDRLIDGRYFVDPRMKLAGQAAGHLLPDATNEVVVHTSHVTKMRLFEISVDGSPVGRIRADGVILATPTGSTSYSLSALGPILEPGVEGIVVSALAPFQAMQRAVVVDPLRTVTVRLVASGKEGVVVVDGQSEAALHGGESVTVYRSARRARFVRFSPSFFHRLGGKGILPWSNEVADSEGSSRADLSSPAS